MFLQLMAAAATSAADIQIPIQFRDNTTMRQTLPQQLHHLQYIAQKLRACRDSIFPSIIDDSASRRQRRGRTDKHWDVHLEKASFGIHPGEKLHTMFTHLL